MYRVREFNPHPSAFPPGNDTEEFFEVMQGSSDANVMKQPLAGWPVTILHTRPGTVPDRGRLTPRSSLGCANNRPETRIDEGAGKGAGRRQRTESVAELRRRGYLETPIGIEMLSSNSGFSSEETAVRVGRAGYFCTIDDFRGPRTASRSFFSFVGTLSLSRTVTRSCTTASKASLVTPRPMCAWTISGPV